MAVAVVDRVAACTCRLGLKAGELLGTSRIRRVVAAGGWLHRFRAEFKETKARVMTKNPRKRNPSEKECDQTSKRSVGSSPLGRHLRGEGKKHGGV